MDDHPAQFLLFSNSVDAGIFRYSFQANEQVAFNNRRILVGEGNDIGKRIVLEVGLVEMQQVFIAAEYDLYGPELMVFPFDDCRYPLVEEFRIGQVGMYVFEMEGDPIFLLAGGFGPFRRHILNLISTVLPLL